MLTKPVRTMATNTSALPSSVLLDIQVAVNGSNDKIADAAASAIIEKLGDGNILSSEDVKDVYKIWSNYGASDLADQLYATAGKKATNLPVLMHTMALPMRSNQVWNNASKMLTSTRSRFEPRNTLPQMMLMQTWSNDMLKQALQRIALTSNLGFLGMLPDDTFAIPAGAMSPSLWIGPNSVLNNPQQTEMYRTIQKSYDRWSALFYRRLNDVRKYIEGHGSVTLPSGQHYTRIQAGTNVASEYYNTQQVFDGVWEDVESHLPLWGFEKDVLWQRHYHSTDFSINTELITALLSNILEGNYPQAIIDAFAAAANTAKKVVGDARDPPPNAPAGVTALTFAPYWNAAGQYVAAKLFYLRYEMSWSDIQSKNACYSTSDFTLDYTIRGQTLIVDVDQLNAVFGSTDQTQIESERNYVNRNGSDKKPLTTAPDSDLKP